MGNWKPDEDFLDFMVDSMLGGPLSDEEQKEVNDIFDSTGHPNPYEAVERMRAGDEDWKPTYDSWYEEFKDEYQMWKKNP